MDLVYKVFEIHFMLAIIYDYVYNPENTYLASTIYFTIC